MCAYWTGSLWADSCATLFFEPLQSRIFWHEPPIFLLAETAALLICSTAWHQSSHNYTFVYALFFIFTVSVHYYFCCIALITLVEFASPLQLPKSAIQEENQEINKKWRPTAHHTPVLGGDAVTLWQSKSIAQDFHKHLIVIWFPFNIFII